MKIENEEILFLDARLTNLKLNDLQKNYLQVLLQERSIEKTFLFYLKQGWLINFNEFYHLIESLLQLKAIRNLNFYHAFQQKTSPLNKDFESQKSNTTFGINLEEKNFFRHLPTAALQAFKKNSQGIEVPERSLLIRENETSREMYYVADGELAVYKSRNGQKVRIATLSAGSLFGEASFMWGAARTADIVTLTKCRLIRFSYKESDFSDLIQKDLAQKNQIRFWALHAFMKSPLLKELPSDNIDELIQCGRQLSLRPSEILFQENSIGSSFYILVQGHLRISQKGKVINQLNQGDLLGEIALFVSGGRRTATIESLTDSILIEIPKDLFYKIISRNLFLAREIESLAWERIQKDQQRAQV